MSDLKTIISRLDNGTKNKHIAGLLKHLYDLKEAFTDASYGNDAINPGPINYAIYGEGFKNLFTHLWEFLDFYIKSDEKEDLKKWADDILTLLKEHIKTLLKDFSLEIYRKRKRKRRKKRKRRRRRRRRRRRTTPKLNPSQSNPFQFSQLKKKKNP
jgi:hypothetical protein